MKIKASTLLLALLFAIPTAGQTTPHFDGQTWWNHIKVLADDKLEGRDTGSRGERAAQAYAIEQLKSAGAEPAGVNGFYQPVKFVSRQIVEKDCNLSLIRDGKREALTLGEDAIIGTRVMPAPEVEAPLVFAGYGLKVPEKNYDDFAGVDIRGKIIVILAGSPSEIPGALASHYQTAAERWKVLRAAGAVGTHFRRNRRSGKGSQATTALSACRFARRENESGSHEHRVGEPGCQTPRQRSRSER